MGLCNWAHKDTLYLERFFQNQLCGTRHGLKNRYLHLDWPQREDAEVTHQDTDQVTDQDGNCTDKEIASDIERLKAYYERFCDFVTVEYDGTVSF